MPGNGIQERKKLKLKEKAIDKQIQRITEYIQCSLCSLKVEDPQLCKICGSILCSSCLKKLFQTTRINGEPTLWDTILFRAPKQYFVCAGPGNCHRVTLDDYTTVHWFDGLKKHLVTLSQIRGVSVPLERKNNDDDDFSEEDEEICC